MAYSAEQKAMAVAIIRRYGGMTRDALVLVRETLDAPGLSKSTLHGWLPPNVEPNRTAEPDPNRIQKKETGAPVPPEMQAKAEQTLDSMFEATARRYLQHALTDGVLEAVKGKDAVIAAATATDKMRLLRGLPTEIIELLPGLVSALEAAGMNPVTTFERMIQKAHERTRAE